MNSDPAFAELLARTQQMAKQIASQDQEAQQEHVLHTNDAYSRAANNALAPWLLSSGLMRDLPGGGNTSIDSYLRSNSLDSDVLAGLEDMLDDDGIDSIYEDQQQTRTNAPAVHMQPSTSHEQIIQQTIGQAIQQSEPLLARGSAHAIAECASLYARVCEDVLSLGLPPVLHEALRSSVLTTANAGPEQRVVALRQVLEAIYMLASGQAPAEDLSKGVTTGLQQQSRLHQFQL